MRQQLGREGHRRCCDGRQGVTFDSNILRHSVMAPIETTGPMRDAGDLPTRKFRQVCAATTMRERVKNVSAQITVSPFPGTTGRDVVGSRRPDKDSMEGGLCDAWVHQNRCAESMCQFCPHVRACCFRLRQRHVAQRLAASRRSRATRARQLQGSCEA